GPGAEPEALAVTMRTPGNDFELAAGFCAGEGIISHVDDLRSIAYCLLPDDEQEYNVVTVRLRKPFDPGPFRRNVTTTSSCGLCGTTSLDQVQRACSPLPPGPAVPAAVVAR